MNKRIYRFDNMVWEGPEHKSFPNTLTFTFNSNKEWKDIKKELISYIEEYVGGTLVDFQVTQLNSLPKNNSTTDEK